MLERFFVKPQTVDRIMGCWLGSQIDQYVTALCEQGYAVRSIYRRVPILTAFADFTAARNVNQTDQAEALVEAFAIDWLSARRADRSADACRRDRNFVGGIVRHFFSQVVSKSDTTSRRTAWPIPFATQAPRFFDYLREERGLRPSSILHYRHYLRRFERYLQDVGCELAVLSLPVVAGYITTMAQDFGPRAMVSIASTLRVFLRYANREGLLQRDISKQVEVPQHYRLANIPRSISWDSVQKMLDQVDLRNVVGRRDYAMLLLMITYGLRAREVAALTLDDIDWKRDRLAVASSAKKDELDKYLDIARIGDLIDVTTSSDDVEQSKPAPDIFEVVLKKLEVGGPDAVAIGDTPYDAEAARKAKIATIGALCGGFTEDSLRQADCVQVFPCPAALLARFKDSLLAR